MSDNLMTPEFRLSFPALFKATKPKSAPAAQEEKFGCAMLFETGEDLSKLRAAAEAAAIEKWGDNIPKNLRNPFKDQGDQKYDGYVDGAIFINANSKQRPGVVNEQVEAIIDESEIYPGCYCRATVRAFGYGGAGTGFAPGVAFGLQNIQKVRDGESLSGRSAPEEDFAPLEGAGDNTESVASEKLFS